jgi:hypothetical protein
VTENHEEMPEGRESLDAVTRAALTPTAVRTATRARLVARARADGATRDGSGARPVDAAARFGGSRVIIGGLSLALAASLILLVRASGARRDERTAYASRLSTLTKSIDSLGTAVVSRDRLLASLTGSEVRLVRLASAQTASPRALMFWDQATNAWTFIAHNMPQLGAGRTYQLWLVTAKDKISAGVFTVTANGDAVVQASYPLDRKALTAVAVTEEPAGGVPLPTGTMVVVGAAGVN